MANRTFFEVNSLDRGVVELYGRVLFGASGAVDTTTASGTDCVGFSMARASQGVYTITLDDYYASAAAKYITSTSTSNPLLGFSFVLTQTSGTIVLLTPVITANNLTTTTKTLTVKLYAVTGAGDTTPAVTDPASGVVANITIVLRNTSTPRKGT